MMEVLIDLIVEIILQYVRVSSHIVHLKLTQCYVSVLSQQVREGGLFLMIHKPEALQEFTCHDWDGV